MARLCVTVVLLAAFMLQPAVLALAQDQPPPPSEPVEVLPEAPAEAPAETGTTEPPVEDAPSIEVVATPEPLPTQETQLAAPDDPLVHVVAVGESLATLGAQSGFSVSDLAQRNGLTHPYLLLAGQRVSLPAPMSQRIRLHRAAPGETLTGLAAQYGVSPYLLRITNKLICASCLIVGQLLRIPQAEVATNLPEPFEQVDITPRVPRQGDVVVVRVRTSRPVQEVAGALAGRPLRFVPQNGGYAALTGVAALQEPGVYSVTIRAIAESGAASEVSGRIQTSGGGFGYENLVVSSKLAYLLDPQVNRDERDQLDTILSQWSGTQWWQGPLELPARGRIASYFGARRSFNSGVLRTYHSGMDLVAPAGTPVSAAAPGRVTAVQQFMIRGLVVILDHGRGVFTLYCHLSKTEVKPGQIVDVGQRIGLSGNTGRSEGPHLHWELAVGGVTVDPLRWIRRPIP